MLSQSPPRKRRSRSARSSDAGSWGSAGAVGTRGGKRRKCERDRADRAEGGADADGVGDGAEHRSDDRSEDGGAEGDPDQLAPARAGRCDGQPGERAGPGRRAREALDEASETERPRAGGEREADAREREQREAENDRPLGAESHRGDSAWDAAEESARPERADEQPRAGLREPELVGVAGHERRERAEEHRVDEDDRADEDEQPAHRPTLPTGAGLRSDRERLCVSSTQARRSSANQASRRSLSEPRRRRTQLQGSWRETGSPRADPVSACATNNSASRVRFRPPPRRTFGISLAASSYGLSVWTRPTRVPCSLQEANYGQIERGSRARKVKKSQIAAFSFHTATICQPRLLQGLVSEPKRARKMSEPRIRHTQLQGSWRGSGSAPADPDPDCATNKFSEPVAVSSAPPTDVSACAYSPSGGTST